MSIKLHPLATSPLIRSRTSWLIAGLCLIFSLIGCQAEHSKPAETLTPFELTRLDGQVINSHQLQGKVVVVNVWATWCPPCRREMPSLQALSEAMNPQQILVIGLTVDTDSFLVREFLSQTAVRFQNFSDPDGKIADLLGVKMYPTTVILNQQGQILHRVIGERDWNSEDIRQKLQAIYAGQTEQAAKL